MQEPVCRQCKGSKLRLRGAIGISRRGKIITDERYECLGCGSEVSFSRLIPAPKTRFGDPCPWPRIAAIV